MSGPWPRRLRILAEFALMFGALLLVDRLTTSGTAFAGIQPNPLWLPVLVMALAYGTEAGLIAAIIASSIWLGNARHIAASGDYLDRLLQLSVTPLLWFLVAALVGEVTILRARRNDRCTREAGVATRNVARLSQAYQQLATTNRALQVRIATDAGATGRIVALASGLSASDAAVRREALGALIAVAAGTTDFTLYRMERDGGVRVLLRGATGTARPHILPTPLITRLRGESRILSVARSDDRLLLADVGVAAVPLMSGGVGIGCLVVHSLAFASLNTRAIAELTEIGTWLPRLMEDGVPPAAVHAHRTGRG